MNCTIKCCICQFAFPCYFAYALFSSEFIFASKLSFAHSILCFIIYITLPKYLFFFLSLQCHHTSVFPGCQSSYLHFGSQMLLFSLFIHAAERNYRLYRYTFTIFSNLIRSFLMVFPSQPIPSVVLPFFSKRCKMFHFKLSSSEL